tara:strand:- start:659 stop:1543 length:885 start_codon:yes stop_codon:yes gene_type:complete
MGNKNIKKLKILILGISGMLGHKAFELLSLNDKYETFGTLRNDNDISIYFSESKNRRNIISGIDALNPNSVLELLDDLNPDLIINCIGIIKQLKESKNPLLSIEINSLFPHRLASHVEGSKTRLIHISTDCVFSGEKGNYTETDNSDAKDLYGKTKFLGELLSYKNSITIRTSIIGPELKGKLSLLEWFLAQKETINGYTKAIYSGFPTIELINIIENYIIPNPQFYGLYNASSLPISKYDLLKIISKVYKKEININPFNEFRTDKSLNCNKFIKDFKFEQKPWPQMILEMQSS